MRSLVACRGGAWTSHGYGYDDYDRYGTSSSSGDVDSSRYSRSSSSGSSAIDSFDPRASIRAASTAAGCFACSPRRTMRLLNACTSRAETFDNAARIAGFDPQTLDRPSRSRPDAVAVQREARRTRRARCRLRPRARRVEAEPIMVVGATGFPLETIAKAMGTQRPSSTSKSSCDGVAEPSPRRSKISGEVVYFGRERHEESLQARGAQPPTSASLLALRGDVRRRVRTHLSPVTMPQDIGTSSDRRGTVMFAVPATSKERAISAEAAYRVFGFGAKIGTMSPWNDERRHLPPRPDLRQPDHGGALARPLDVRLPRSFGDSGDSSSNMLDAPYVFFVAGKTVGINSSGSSASIVTS